MYFRLTRARLRFVCVSYFSLGLTGWITQLSSGNLGTRVGASHRGKAILWSPPLTNRTVIQRESHKPFKLNLYPAPLPFPAAPPPRALFVSQWSSSQQTLVLSAPSRSSSGSPCADNMLNLPSKLVALSTLDPFKYIHVQQSPQVVPPLSNTLRSYERERDRGTV